MNERAIKAANSKYDNESLDKEPFNFVIRSIRNEPERVWSAKELHDVYKAKGGTDTHITRFPNRLRSYMENEVYFFDSPGISTVIMQQKKTSTLFNLVNAPESDNGLELKVVADKIASEMKSIPTLKDTYNVLNQDEISASCSQTLQILLSMISPKFFTNTKVVALISGMINTIVSSKTSMLQVALGMLVQEKQLIEHLHEYGVTSTYPKIQDISSSSK